MKKILSLVIAVFLLSATFSAIAADRDLWADTIESMDLDSLREYAAYIQAEYLARAGEPFDVPAGIYIIGVDFPAGSFTFEIASAVSVEVCVYKSTADFYGDFGFPIFDEILNEYYGLTSIGNLRLVDGNVLVIDGNMTAKPFTGLGS